MYVCMRLGGMEPLRLLKDKNIFVLWTIPQKFSVVVVLLGGWMADIIFK